MINTSLLVAAFIGTSMFGVFSAFWGMIVPEIEKKVGKAATILLANSMGLVIGSLLSGPVIDQLGNKVALSAGIGLVAVGVFVLGKVRSVVPGFLMALLVGIGGSGIVTGANVLVQDIATTDAARGFWGNWINNFFAVGAFVAPIVLARLIARGTRLEQIATILGVICGLGFVYFLFVEFPPPKAAGTSMTAGAGQVLSQPLFWILAAMLLLYVGCEGTVWYWLNKYLTQTLNVPPQAAGTTVSLFAIGIIAGRIVSSYLLGQNILAPLVLTLVGSIGIAICYTGMLMASGLGVIRLLAVLAGVSMAPLFPTVLAATGINFPQNTGTAIGLAVTAGWLGYVFIPPSIGYVANLRKGLFITSAAAVLLVLANIIALGMI
jgi:fucose permease